MKHLTFSILAIICHNALANESVSDEVGPGASPPRDPAYKLVWSDEFEIDGRPDPTKWRFEKGFVRNNELQWYQEANAICKDGLLIIEARREKIDSSDNGKEIDGKTAEYTSSSLTTAGLHDWTYGRMEIRARFPALEGLWPALWTTGRGRWPHGGEIDIMEYYGHQILANFCWAGPHGKDKWDDSHHDLSKFGEETWNEKFHCWVMEWAEDKIEIFLDGHLLNEIDMRTPINEDGPTINPFNSPQAFRVNLAIGGKHGGDPSQTEFPQRYEIDYIRIYQKPALSPVLKPKKPD